MKTCLLMLAIFPWNRDTTLDMVPICSVAVAMANASGEAKPEVKPEPPKPAADKCDACDGTGKNGDGSNARTCWKCGGTGRLKAEPAKLESLPAVPRVQCVIYSDSPRCGPCRLLIERIKPRLLERGWTFGTEAHNRFRVMEFETNEAEFTKRNIATVPTLVFVVDGDEIPTAKRDAVGLATEYLERLEALP